MKNNIIFAVNKLYDAGLDKESNILNKLKWNDELLLGGMLGLSGIVYLMLRAIDILGEVHFNKEIKGVLRNTVDFILSCQLPSGNIPESFSAEATFVKDELVQFCSGATGAIPMFLAAF